MLTACADRPSLVHHSTRVFHAAGARHARFGRARYGCRAVFGQAIQVGALARQSVLEEEAVGNMLCCSRLEALASTSDDVVMKAVQRSREYCGLLVFVGHIWSAGARVVVEIAAHNVMRHHLSSI